MLSKAVNLLLIVLLSSSLTNGVRRKSKIDVPIVNSADAPLTDNVAQATSNDAQLPAKSEDQPSAQALAATEKSIASPIVLQPNAISNLMPSSSGADSSSLGDNSVSSGENEQIECDPDMIGFEIITGYVFSAPDQLLESMPGTLMLTDCLEACQANESCGAVNYETGLCVLFSSNADKLPASDSSSARSTIMITTSYLNSFIIYGSILLAIGSLLSLKLHHNNDSNKPNNNKSNNSNKAQLT